MKLYQQHILLTHSRNSFSVSRQKLASVQNVKGIAFVIWNNYEKVKFLYINNENKHFVQVFFFNFTLCIFFLYDSSLFKFKVSLRNPFQHFNRFVCPKFELGGKTIKTGTLVYWNVTTSFQTKKKQFSWKLIAWTVNVFRSYTKQNKKYSLKNSLHFIYRLNVCWRQKLIFGVMRFAKANERITSRKETNGCAKTTNLCVI